MKSAFEIIKKINDLGYEAYLVGGAVRDYLLGRDSFDIDLATSAPSDVLLKNFKSKPIGLKYGTILIFYNDKAYEVTTFRKDFKYDDYRHPSHVVFTKKLKKDAKRRDFTINGMYMDENYKIIDLVKGQLDLEKKLIKTIGNPNDRFQEDALRMLRAFYFVAKLDFNIESKTFDSIKKNNHLLKKVASERIETELNKLLMSPHYLKALKLLQLSGLHLNLPGLEKGINYLVSGEHSFDLETFYVISYYLNGKIDPFLKLSNQRRTNYSRAIELLNQQLIDEITLFNYSKEEVELAFRANQILKIFEKDLIKIYEQMPICNENDLKIKNTEIIELIKKKPGPWLSQLKVELIHKILLKEINNTKKEITKYILKRKDELWNTN